MANDFNKTPRSISTSSPQNFQTDWRKHLPLVKHWMVFISLVTFLGAWIALSIMNNNLFLSEALIGSAIISSLFFFRTLEQNKQSDKKN